jgi:hypothetical protein
MTLLPADCEICRGISVTVRAPQSFQARSMFEYQEILILQKIEFLYQTEPGSF